VVLETVATVAEVTRPLLYDIQPDPGAYLKRSTYA